MWEYDGGGTPLHVFKWSGDRDGLRFVFSVERERAQERIVYFYASIHNALILTLILICLMMMGSVYFIYRPILELRRKLEQKCQRRHPMPS